MSNYWTLSGQLISASGELQPNTEVAVYPPNLPYTAKAADGTPSIITQPAVATSDANGHFSLQVLSLQTNWHVRVGQADEVYVPDPGPDVVVDISTLTPAYVPSWQGGVRIPWGAGIVRARTTEDGTAVIFDLSNGASLPPVNLTRGQPGEQGPPGRLSIGLVTTSPPGSNASATIVDAGDGSQVLNLSIPRGEGNSVDESVVAGYLSTSGSFRSGLDNLYLLRSNADASFLKKSEASATYLSTATASASYLTKVDAATDYVSKTSAASTYLSQTAASASYLSKTEAVSVYLTQSLASTTYLAQSQVATTDYAAIITGVSGPGGTPNPSTYYPNLITN